MSETAPEAVAEAVEAAAAAGAAAVEPPAEPPAGDAVEAAAEAVEAAAEAVEAAADAGTDETRLDHEQRITRLEEQLAQARADLAEKITFSEAASIGPSYSEVEQTAAVVAAAVAEDIVETETGGTDDDDQGGGEVERVDEAPNVEAVDPGAPPVSEAAQPKRRGLFTW